MTGKRQEEILKRFMDRYSLGASSALNDVEKEAIGAVVGANGYTTVAQADQLIEVLGLEAGTWLLDIGAGRGWPGLYLSKRSRCQAPKASAITLSAISAAASGVSRPRASAKDAPAGACPADFQWPFFHLPIDQRKRPADKCQRASGRVINCRTKVIP